MLSVILSILHLDPEKLHPVGKWIAPVCESVTIQLQKGNVMKLTMNKILQGEDEVIIRYREMNEQIEMLAALVEGKAPRVSARCGDETILISPEAILYLESVDGTTWAYLADQVCRIYESLEKAALAWGERGFFRCSKSMVINIYRISTLKSEPGNRILAKMENGEQVVISRRYARQLRGMLKGGAEDEE